MSIYVDGSLDAWAASSPNISVNDYSVHIGANAQAEDRLFRGLIDDVRIYDRASPSMNCRRWSSQVEFDRPPPSHPVATALPSLPGEFRKTPSTARRSRAGTPLT